MNKLEIKKLYLKGFKSYLEPKEFSLSNNTLIEGDNAKGKTSIGESIVWAFLGTDLNGNERATTRLINDKSKVIEVIVEFTFDNVSHILIRRKKGSSNEIYLDDKKVNNSDLAREFLKSKEVFLTIFNPSYFSAIAPKDAKEFLTGVIKEVDKEKCLDELGDFLKDKLVENNFLVNSVTFIKDKRSELKELEENSIYLEGIIDGQNKIDIPETKAFDDTELNVLKEEIENVTIKSNEELINIENELNKLNIEIRTIPYEKPQLINIRQLEVEKDTLLKEYKDYKLQYEGLKSKTITCNKCGNEIDINEFERDRLANIMKDIIEKGKFKASEIEEVNAKNNLLELEYLEKVNSYKLEKTKQIEDIKLKINALRDKQLEENKAIELKRNEIKVKINELQQQKNEVMAFNMNIESLKNQQLQIVEKINNSKEELANNNLKIKEINFLIDAAKQFNSLKLKKQTQFIGNYLNKVKLKFEKLTKDGELKEDFKITYEGREFNTLSNAERIKAGLEISNLVMSLLDVKLPIFIDNAESITEVPEIDTQVILAKVVEGKELQIA